MHLDWFQQPSGIHRSPNALLIGATGTGKTHTIRSASEILRIPFIVTDATSLVPSGFVGEQIEDVLKNLVGAAQEVLRSSGEEPSDHADIELARRGVLFIDEFDKLAAPVERYSEEGASKRVVQRRLLKLIEGSVLRVGVKYHTSDPDRFIDTSGILVIASGAFTGIDAPEIRGKRPPVLLDALLNPNEVITADLISYGFIPELVARMPVLIRYAELAAGELLEILSRADISPLTVWREYFRKRNKTISVTDEAMAVVADQASKLKMGARGLQQILFPRLARIAYEFEVSAEDTYVLTVDDFERPRPKIEEVDGS
ncbi:AAA family ATPase [Nonomuraea sp. NPDC052129]|uniref:AAA family ATPase n=1 Tax=Nonomuraea sp. NPDC052129 TaxID=3154651 RepID=UPI0034242BA4